MIDWWESREPREKLLMTVAALLTLIILVQQFLVRPLLAAQTEARIFHQRAAAALDIVAADGQAIKAFRSSALPANSGREILKGDALRAALTSLAAQRGLEISRLQTTAEGGFSINLDNADPQQFFDWLAEAEVLFGAETQSVSMAQTANGQVRIAIDFAGSPT